MVNAMGVNSKSLRCIKLESNIQHNPFVENSEENQSVEQVQKDPSK